MCPAIFLPLNTRPGSWRLPVEPCERCATETPWLARSPLNPQRFMAPAKPLPMLVPHTSTNWPITKWPTVRPVPGSSSASSLTRNSASLALGITLALAKWPRIGLVTFFALARPTPSWTAA